MATIKSYTDLEQSKALAEFLPLESADMWWNFYSVTTDDTTPQIIHLDTPWVGNFNWDNKHDNVPCWSLAALLDVLPSRLFDSTPKRKELYLLPDLDKSYCFYRQFAVKTKGKIYLLTEGECLVDACVGMIEKLHEQNIL